MDIGSVFLLLALLILVGVYVAWPLIDRRAIVVNSTSDEDSHKLSTLMAERDRILSSLEELDFDYTLGKIPAEDYPGQRARLLQEGAQVLRQLDAMEHRSSAEDLEARLEAVIADRRVAVSSVAVDAANAGSDEQVEALLAARRRARQVKSAGFCPQCGRPVQKTDQFCPRCGQALV